MSTTYDEIMDALLKAHEEHPEMDVNEIIKQVFEKFGASDACNENISKTSSLLDKVQEKKASLEKAREEGKSRKKWVLSQIEDIAGDRSGEEKCKIVEAISDGVHKSYESSIYEKEI